MTHSTLLFAARSPWTCLVGDAARTALQLLAGALLCAVCIGFVCTQARAQELAHTPNSSTMPLPSSSTIPPHNAASAAATAPALKPAPAKKSTSQSGRYGANSVWTPAQVDRADLDRWRECRHVVRCAPSVMKASGASAQAVRYFLDNAEEAGFLSAFVELGRVDLGEETYPFRANTNSALVMLNGNPERLSSEIFDGLPMQHLPGFAGLQVKFPYLELWGSGAEWIAHTGLVDGGQRMVFLYPLRDGCHVCDTGHSVLVAFDFGPNGKFKKRIPLAIVPDTDRPPAQAMPAAPTLSK